MATQDIVVIGGSAGSIDVFQRIVERFPAGMPAAVFVITHMSPRAKSYLPEILGNKSGIPAHQAVDGERIEAGTIYTAPPDQHLLIAEGHIHLSRAPKEGLHRPSINVTFRSAAITYGPRVMGVLVSGLLDDGAAGLWEIAQHGGITVVQDPDEAPYPSMPLSALQDSAVDYQLTAPEIGNLIVGMASGKLEPRLQARRPGDAGEDQFSGFTCPECRGPLYTTRRPGPIEFHCRVGHILSFQTLVDEGTSTQERKLYEAIVALQEGADLAAFAADRADGVVKEKLRKESAQLRDDAEVIRQMIENRLMPSLL